MNRAEIHMIEENINSLLEVIEELDKRADECKQKGLNDIAKRLRKKRDMAYAELAGYDKVLQILGYYRDTNVGSDTNYLVKIKP